MQQKRQKKTKKKLIQDTRTDIPRCETRRGEIECETNQLYKYMKLNAF